MAKKQDIQHSRERIRDVDFPSVQKELLRALRGNRSQIEISEKLGFHFNKVTKWENGSNKISWEFFARYLNIKNIVLGPYFRQYHGIDKYNEDDANELFYKLVAHISPEIQCKTFNVSKTKLYRMYSGDVVIYLDIMLKAIFCSSPDFLSFVKLITNDLPIPSLAKFFNHQSDRRLFSRYPEITLLLRTLEFHSYHQLPGHSDRYISDLLKMDQDRVQQLIKIAEDNELIEFDGTRYLVLAKATNIADIDAHNLWRDKSYWLERYCRVNKSKIENFDQHQEDMGNLGYLIAGMTQQAREQVILRLTQCYSEITAILGSEVNRNKKDGSNKLEDIFYIHVGIASILDK